MSNYTKTTNFATKDNLSPGNPLKIVKGTEIDTEYNNIATAVATKTDGAASSTDNAIARFDSTTGKIIQNSVVTIDDTTGDIVGTATQGVFNTVSTTVNAFGAATTLNLGAATGTATVANTTLAAKAITASTTLAVTGTSTLTGAVTATAGVTGPITSSSATITGGSITGITDLAVADGGTGASTAAGGLNNLLPSQTGNANKYLQTDGTNASWDAVSLSTADITGTLGVANGGTGVTTSTGTTNVVLSNSPTLVTPALGTPSAAVLTNATGLPISTGVSGLGTGVATLLATPSSANLASAITDETGSGSLVFATSPTLVTPILGTPTSGTLTNATGLPISTGVSGLGTGVATFLATPSSANLLSALTDETGTGSAVFATSPTLVTPILGTPTSGTATNLTGLPLTTGVTGLLPVANGGTATATPSIVAGTNITVTGTWPNQTIAASGGSGTVTSVAATVPSLFSISGSPITTSGTLAMTYSGTALPVVNGGTGETSYTNGQLLIGNTTGNTLTKATLTAGSGITITNGTGSISIAASGSGDVVGPASSTDNAIARFDSTTGKLLQNSTATLGDAGEAVFATGTFGASSGGVTTVTAIGNTLSNIVIGDPSTASSSSGIQFKGGSSTTNWVISGNGNVNSGIEITPSTTVNGTTFNAPVVKVTSTGLIAKTTIAVGNATPSASGSGITFPATQSASTDANTLDDYEEGTWTPTVVGGYTGVTYSSQHGWYTKVGRSVVISGRVNFSGTANSTGISVGGLPFSQGNLGGGAYGGGGIPYTTVTVVTNASPYVSGNTVEYYTMGTGGQITSSGNVSGVWLSFVISISTD